MYFKKLEILGFKSFLNKTKLKFEPGVTAIVGPNGCGKSNIVDAIKWVLGEQSVKSMRSSSMQDVIFNGTEKYDPLNFAEVSLTLSNENRTLPVDYDEVTISRRLYRSGESEYLLNKTPVRLVDVRRLIMGTGIGTSSYSIVEQGRMDMILSSKPEERRYVFEEASGITRYKSQKREAILKLERTKENLVRINDITLEVEKQIKSIERKARKAARYKEQFEELKGLEIKRAYSEYKGLGADNSSLGDEDGLVRGKVEELSKELESSSDALMETKEAFNQCLMELQTAQNEVLRFSSEVDKNEHRMEVNSERVLELNKYTERLQWEIKESEERKEGLSGRVSKLEVRFKDARTGRLRKSEEFNLAQDTVKEITGKIEELKEGLKVKKEKTLDILTDETKARNSLIKINADIQNAEARERRLEIERSSVQAEKDKASLDMKSIDARAEALISELALKRSEAEAINKEFSIKNEELEALSTRKLDKEKELNSIVPRRQFLEKLLTDREGINDSVKKVMLEVEAGDARFSGVRGILSELLNVRDEYEESMESVLGDIAQAIVVNNRDTAEKITMFLKDNSMTSVNIIMLDELSNQAPGSHQAASGALNDITQVIMAGEPYYNAVRVLLRNMFVAGSSSAADDYVRENAGFDGRIIGMKGEVFQNGLRRSRNYSQEETIPIFGRREKVDQMRCSEETIKGELKEAASRICGVKAWLSECLLRKEKVESALREKEVESADIFSRRSTMREKIASYEEELLLIAAEKEQEQSILQELAEGKNGFERALNDLEAASARLHFEIEEAQRILQEYGHKREEGLFRMSDIKAELSALIKEEENISENLERESESCKRIFFEIEEKTGRIDVNKKRIEELETESRLLEQLNAENDSTMQIQRGRIDELEGKKSGLSSTIRTEEERFRGRERELEETKNTLRDLDIRKKDIEYKKAVLQERMKDRYKVDIAVISLEVDLSTDWQAVSERVGVLREELEKMGEVSLEAVDELKDLEERYQFLTKQRDDLVESRESLLKAIAKINRTTRGMFMETFEAIRKEFNDYFKMLFNGGKADLVLEDENNILECGIDIVVRPPGKKLHNIMQLSGGEKAMTAIALIFAIFKVNPSPFCILDEIDAPLDESNVVRFCRVLQEFLKLSQFVIVTHNRMTIQLADVLYGITMEEKGVSKIVSVKFSEEEAKKEETVPQTV